MCEGTVTELRCGHILVHRSKDCGGGCEVPRGPHYYLDDICAPCQLLANRELRARRYEGVEARLKARLRAAEAERRGDEARQICDALRALHWDRLLNGLGHSGNGNTGQEKQQPSSTGLDVATQGDVVWPGKPPQTPPLS